MSPRIILSSPNVTRNVNVHTHALSGIWTRGPNSRTALYVGPCTMTLWMSRNQVYIVTYSGFSIHDGTLLYSKSQYTTAKHSQKLLEHTYTSDLYGTATLIPIGFFQQDLLWQSSNTHSHSCSHKASKHTRSIRRRAIGPLAHHNGTSAYSPSLACTSPDDRMSSSSTVLTRVLLSRNFPIRTQSSNQTESNTHVCTRPISLPNSSVNRNFSIVASLFTLLRGDVRFHCCVTKETRHCTVTLL
jgi:hypothetical protein